jgi:hypothetical protein
MVPAEVAELRSRRKQRSEEKRRISPLVVTQAVLIAAALLLYFFPPSPPWVERYFSNGYYPGVQRSLASVSNRIPFTVSDVLIVLLAIGLPGWWVIRIRSAASGRRAVVVGRLAFGTAALAAAVFLLFQALWGLNYLREPLTNKLDYDRSRVTETAAIQLADLGVTELNALTTAAHRSAWPDRQEWSKRLQSPFEQAVADLGNSGGTRLSRPKTSLFNFYLSAAGIDGFTNPFGMEIVLDSRLLPQEQPFAIAHEWAHLAGFADESEANFIALITCLRSEDLSVRYAGWLSVYPSLAHAAASNAALHNAAPSDPASSNAAASNSAGDNKDERPNRPQLAKEVSSDLAAIQKRRLERVKTWVSGAEWRIYDRFLKANGVQAGIESYDLFIELALGTRFAPTWIPQLRSK